MSNTNFYRLVGVVIVGASLGALYVDARFAWVAVLFGAHLIQFTFTGFCILQKLLPKA